MNRVIYTVEISGSRYEPFWTDMATDRYALAEGHATERAQADPWNEVRLVEWEDGQRTRTTNYGRE